MNNNPAFTTEEDGHTLSWVFYHNNDCLSFGICFDRDGTKKNTGWWVVSGEKGNIGEALIEDGTLPQEFVDILVLGQGESKNKTTEKGGDANE